MHKVNTPDAVRRVVDYWASEGVTWLKFYTDVSREVLGAAIKQAHKRGVKVTGHLCSVSFREAVALGIDNLEHGLFVNTDFDPEKRPDFCPPDALAKLGEPRYPGRGRAGPHPGDGRAQGPDDLDPGGVRALRAQPAAAGAAGARGDGARRPRRIPHQPRAPGRSRAPSRSPPRSFARRRQFELEFVRAGGLLAAGVDPPATAARSPASATSATTSC